jgi:hypothetical protein
LYVEPPQNATVLEEGSCADPELSAFLKLTPSSSTSGYWQRKFYALSLAPVPDLIARVWRYKAHETAAELVVSAAIPKTPEILDWPADF